MNQQAYKSLQGRYEVCPLPTPRRYHAILTLLQDAVRLHRCEPRFHLGITPQGDPFDRTRVRKRSASRFLHAYPVY